MMKALKWLGISLLALFLIFWFVFVPGSLALCEARMQAGPMVDGERCGIFVLKARP